MGPTKKLILKDRNKEVKKNESDELSFLTKKRPGTYGFTDKFDKTFKRKMFPIFL